MEYRKVKISDRAPKVSKSYMTIGKENGMPCCAFCVYDPESDQWLPHDMRLFGPYTPEYWLEEIDWIPIDQELPEEYDKYDCPEKYLVKTEHFGQQLALFHKGKFYENLAAPFENVTHWRYMPDDPKS